MCGYIAAILLNGLRDYGLELQVWGGEPACKHEWLDELPARQQSGGVASFQTTNAGSFHAGQVSASCRHCNAWRGSLGLEPTLDLYLNHMVEVCREIRRVLRKNGTFWLNIGDSYASNWPCNRRSVIGARSLPNGKREARPSRLGGLKEKDLMLIPSRLAIALQNDGWWVRSEIVWAKDAPMPESVTDRPTCAHEKIFLLTKSARYYYDAEAVKEPTQGRELFGNIRSKGFCDDRQDNERHDMTPNWARNLRNLWRLSPSPFPDAHFATFPPELPRRCIVAGTSEKGVCPKCGTPWARIIKKGPLHPVRGNYLSQITDNHKTSGTAEIVYNASKTMVRTTEGWSLLKRDAETIGWRPTCSCNAGNPIPATVLDPFAGSGTTLLVADQLQRNAIGIELNPSYANMAHQRIQQDAPLFATVLADNILQPQLL